VPRSASHAGSAALTELADKLGWSAALSAGMAPTRQRRSAHDPGRVVRDLIVAIADGGDCLADLNVLREQPDLFGEVASLPTAWRVIAAITPERLGLLREARRQVRERAWAKGAAPERITLDFDATLVTAHSEKEGAAGNFKGGFGFHPLACYLDESNEALAAILRPATPAPTPRPTTSPCCSRPWSNCPSLPGAWRSWPEPTPAALPTTS
jgi:hypothetical protein